MIFSMAFVFSIIPIIAYTSEGSQEITQVKYGNFLLPVSQQPSPLFSIGQNIIEKGDAMAFVSTVPFVGPDQYSVTVVPYFLYGITDACSVLVGVPFAFLKDDRGKNAGIADIAAQLEYAFYENKQTTYTYQATCLGALFLPTGSTKKAVVDSSLVLGSGSFSFLFGGTVSYYATDWLWFVSAGGLIATKGRTLRSSSNFLYQGGFGKNLATRPGWIFTWIIEFNGVYSTRQRVCSVTQRNSGSNVLYVTPSLWASSERFIIQAGITLLPVQHLFGCQTGKEIGGMISLGWKFNGV